MNLKRLQYFVVVAEELHFGKAARRLNISQPPLSQQIKLLEYEVGVSLFERSRHGVKLTREGYMLLPEARSILDHGDRFQQTAEQIKSGEIGQISIGFVPSTMFGVLPLILNHFFAEYPNIDLILREGTTIDTLEAVSDGRLDIGFIWLDKANKEIQVEHSWKEPFIVALPLQHPLSQKKNISVTDLTYESFILSPRSNTPFYFDKVISICVNAGFSPRIIHQTKSIVTQIGCVACGLGVAIVPQAAQNLPFPNVAFCHLNDCEAAVAISVIRRKNIKSSIIDDFFSIAKQEAG